MIYKLIYVKERQLFGIFNTKNNTHHAIHSGTPMEANKLDWNPNRPGGAAEEYLQLAPEVESNCLEEILNEYQVLRLLKYHEEAF